MNVLRVREHVSKRDKRVDRKGFQINECFLLKEEGDKVGGHTSCFPHAATPL